MIVMKFGGTSVGDAERIRNLKKIIDAFKEEKIVVVSAMNGITDSLVRAGTLSQLGDKSYLKEYLSIKDKHESVMKELFNENLPHVEKLLEELLNILKSIEVLGELTSRALDTIVSFGERMVVRIISEYLSKSGINSTFVDANTFLITTDDFGNALPIYAEIEKRALFLKDLLSKNIIPIVTGFIGSTIDGRITTLGRGGSDFTATILGKALDAREVWIWTDVDGVMTADPRVVKDAKPLSYISYVEAAELSYYGAKVLHPKTLLPVMEKNIPVRIKNTFNPEFPGTVIVKKIRKDENVVKSITYIKDLTLVSVNGKGMIGVPGVSARVFESARRSKTNILMISQASSEQNICLVVKTDEAKSFVDRLRKEFEKEIEREEIEGILRMDGISIISVVGAGMKGTPGIAGKVFSALGRHGINIIAIAQGSSEYNISFVVKYTEVKEAVNILHTELGLALDKKDIKVVEIVQFGVGKVGKALIEMILKNRERIEKSKRIRIVYRGIVRKNSYIVGEEAEEYIKKMNFNFPVVGKVDLEKLIKKNTVVVDVSDSDEMKDTLLFAVKKGAHVVTSNKKNLTGDMKYFESFTGGVGKFYFETTVGASLPVIKTLTDLVETGDRVKKIVSLPSGSLSFIFYHINRGKDIMDALKMALDLGYTEPNPMDDLKGFDILRKSIIMARVIGKGINLSDVEFKEFVKSNNLKEFEEGELKLFRKMIEEMRKKGFVYPVSKITGRGVSVSIESFETDSEFSLLKPGENIFIIYTERYGKVPIIIKGIGAGPEITASGVLSDILRVGREI
ncbi:MAG: bifunctional aspartate kinase/homoserine dehydrogenase I [Caldisericaceae bacterium]